MNLNIRELNEFLTCMTFNIKNQDTVLLFVKLTVPLIMGSGRGMGDEEWENDWKESDFESRRRRNPFFLCITLFEKYIKMHKK